MHQANAPKKYFDLHLTGLGYLSRVREVTSAGNGRAKARPFLACSIAAFHGDPDVENGVIYLNLDLIVSGEKAKDAILSVMDHANDRDAKVLVGFRAGDHYISTYEIKQGNRAGQMGTVLKGRLLKVFWIKVGGEFVYQDESQEDQVDAQADDDDPDRSVSGDEGFDGAAAEVRASDPPADATGVHDATPAQPSADRQVRVRGQRATGLDPARAESALEGRRGNSFLRRASRRTGTAG